MKMLMLKCTDLLIQYKTYCSLDGSDRGTSSLSDKVGWRKLCNI